MAAPNVSGTCLTPKVPQSNARRAKWIDVRWARRADAAGGSVTETITSAYRTGR